MDKLGVFHANEIAMGLTKGEDGAVEPVKALQ